MPDAIAQHAPRRPGIDDMPGSNQTLAEIERARPAHDDYEPGDVEREYALPIPTRPAPTPWQDGEVRIPKAKAGPIEAEAKSLYQMLPLTARVLVRLLDHGAAQAASQVTIRPRTPNNMWCIRLHDLQHAVPAKHWQHGELDKLLFGAIERLEEFKVGCLIPGHHMDRPVIFASRYAHRSMLRSRVLRSPKSIPIVRLSDKILAQALDCFITDNDAA